MQQDTYLAVGGKKELLMYITRTNFTIAMLRKNTVNLSYCFTLILKHPIKVIEDQWFPKDKQEVKARREDSLIA